MAYKGQIYNDESDADDEYERSVIASPTVATHFGTSPTDSEGGLHHSNQHTPTFPGKPLQDTIKEWTKQQCADFIASFGLNQYIEAFIDDDIDGAALVSLTQEDLKDLGVASVGHRLTILKAVYEIKVQQNVSIEPDNYVPPSADANAPDANATQDDVARIIKQIQLRDDRLQECEAELQRFQEALFRFQEEQRKFREDILPLARMAKDKNAPLPTPDGLEAPNPMSPPAIDPQGKGTLTRKRSKTQTRGFFTGMKIPSPTIQEHGHLEASAAAMAASNHLSASMSSAGNSSPHMSQQPSPTSPQYSIPSGPGLTPRSVPNSANELNPSSQNISYRERERADGLTRSRVTPTSATHPLTTSITNTSQNSAENPLSATSTTPSSSLPGASKDPDANHIMKSFRVSMEEPCHKVLPVALKKYNIIDDWRSYSLYIVYGDKERCLDLDEKPLILFKQLANEGKKPMFMLRKHANAAGVAAAAQSATPGLGTPNSAGPPSAGVPGSAAGSSIPAAGSAGLGIPGAGGGGLGGLAASQTPGSTVRQSYASSMHLPGGVV